MTFNSKKLYINYAKLTGANLALTRYLHVMKMHLVSSLKTCSWNQEGSIALVISFGRNLSTMC